MENRNPQKKKEIQIKNFTNLVTELVSQETEHWHGEK